MTPERVRAMVNEARANNKPPRALCVEDLICKIVLAACAEQHAESRRAALEEATRLPPAHGQHGDSEVVYREDIIELRDQPQTLPPPAPQSPHITLAKPPRRAL